MFIIRLVFFHSFFTVNTFPYKSTSFFFKNSIHQPEKENTLLLLSGIKKRIMEKRNFDLSTTLGSYVACVVAAIIIMLVISVDSLETASFLTWIKGATIFGAIIGTITFIILGAMNYLVTKNTEAKKIWEKLSKE